MIRIPLTATRLAAVRFALSPLSEAVAVLHLLRQQQGSASRRPWAASARTVLAQRRLALLWALTNAGSDYFPDVLTPEPRSFEAHLDEELNRVATAPAERVAREIDAMVTGRARAGLTGAPLPRTVRTALDRGETAFAQRLADELDVFSFDVIAPHWGRLRGALVDDVDRRAEVMARRGSGALWSTLGPGVTWHGDVVRIESRYEVEVGWGEAIILMPSMIAGKLGTGVDPCHERSTFLVYPALRDRSPTHRGPGLAALAELLGHTRAALLASLTSPRSTTDLATMHHLTPPTVSYHLTRLRRGGLAERVRHGRTVLYQRTARASALVNDSLTPPPS